MIFSALVAYHKIKLASLEIILFKSAPDTHPGFMVEAVEVVVCSKYWFLQLDLKELGLQDANTTFTNKSARLQNLCKYMWNCPEMVGKGPSSMGNPLCPKTPSVPC